MRFRNPRDVRRLSTMRSPVLARSKRDFGDVVWAFAAVMAVAIVALVAGAQL